MAVLVSEVVSDCPGTTGLMLCACCCVRGAEMWQRAELEACSRSVWQAAGVRLLWVRGPRGHVALHASAQRLAHCRQKTCGKPLATPIKILSLKVRHEVKYDFII